MKLSRNAPSRAGARPERRSRWPVRVALDREHRMHDQPDLEPALGELAHDRVDQKRHVVGDDFDHRYRPRTAARLDVRHRLEADFRRTRPARAAGRPKLPCQVAPTFRAHSPPGRPLTARPYSCGQSLSGRSGRDGPTGLLACSTSRRAVLSSSVPSRPSTDIAEVQTVNEAGASPQFRPLRASRRGRLRSARAIPGMASRMPLGIHVSCD